MIVLVELRYVIGMYLSFNSVNETFGTSLILYAMNDVNIDRTNTNTLQCVRVVRMIPHVTYSSLA